MESDFNPSELTRRDSERLNGYRHLLDFYHGLQWEGRPARSEKRLTFNYARVFIEKATSYLMSGVTFAVDPLEDTPGARAGAQSAEAALHRVYEENNLEQLDMETETDCAILGDAAYKVTWDPETNAVRVTAPDIQGIHVWTAGDDVTRVWRVASKYSLDRESAAGLWGAPGGSSPFTGGTTGGYQGTKKVPHYPSGSPLPTPRGKGTISVVEVWTAGGFELWADDVRLERKPNPYGFIPFVIFPNLREPKSFWGVSDLVQIRETQRELNRAMSQLSRILELSGNPIAVLENVRESDDIAVNPGAVWNVPEDAKAYLLDLLQGGGVRLHIDYVNLLYRVLHDLSESPRASFGGTERDLSGVALEIELQPLLQKVRRKRLVRTAAYNRRNRMILRLLEKYGGDPSLRSAQAPLTFSLRVVWGPVLPQDSTKLAADEQVLVQNGIHSRRRAMDELGVKDPEAEFGRWLEEESQIRNTNIEARDKSESPKHE